MARGRLTSAITNPLHEEIRQAVGAADVLLGHDPTARRGSAVPRERRGGREGGRRGAAATRAAAAAGRAEAAAT